MMSARPWESDSSPDLRGQFCLDCSSVASIENGDVYRCRHREHQRDFYRLIDRTSTLSQYATRGGFLPEHRLSISIRTKQYLAMLSASSTKALPVPRHLWSNDSEIGKIRRSLFIFWLRSSILLWILILLIALIYLGSGVVRGSFVARSPLRCRCSSESHLAHAIAGCIRDELR